MKKENNNSITDVVLSYVLFCNPVRKY